MALIDPYVNMASCRLQAMPSVVCAFWMNRGLGKEEIRSFVIDASW